MSAGPATMICALSGGTEATSQHRDTAVVGSCDEGAVVRGEGNGLKGDDLRRSAGTRGNDEACHLLLGRPIPQPDGAVEARGARSSASRR